MDGKKLKFRLKELHLKSRSVAEEMGVTEQAMTSFYKATDIRDATLERIDKAIKKMTDGAHGLYDDAVPDTKEMGGATSTPPIGTSDQQMDALGFAAGQIGKMTTSLIIALDRINKREAELEERINRVSRLEEIIDRRLKVLSKYIDADKLPFGGIGNISIPDMAADDAPDPNQSNDVKHNGKRGGGK